PARVAIVHRVSHQAAGAVQEAEVDGPGVDRDRVDGGVQGSCTQAVERLLVQAKDVPVERPANPHGRVGEPVHFRDSDPLTVEPAHCDPATLGAEVDSGHDCHQPRWASFRTARRRSRGRTGRGSRGPGSTVTTSTPAARQAWTSLAGALESVMIPASW